MPEIWVRLWKVVREPRYVLWKWQTAMRRRLRVLRRRLPGRRSAPDVQKCIAMIHIGRSGSTVLGDMLDQHPDIAWDGEVWLEMRRAGLASRPEELSRESFVAFLVHRQRLATGGTYGYEVKFFHIESLGVSIASRLEALESAGPTVFVVLERRNSLRKIVSSLKAATSTHWHQPAGSKAKLSRVTIDPDDVRIDGRRSPLLPLLRSYQQSFEELRVALADRPHLWLTYEEDLAQSPTLAYRKILDFAGLCPHEVGVRYGKTNPYPLAEVVENYEEVREHLRATEFEWMTTEGEVRP